MKQRCAFWTAAMGVLLLLGGASPGSARILRAGLPHTTRGTLEVCAPRYDRQAPCSKAHLVFLLTNNQFTNQLLDLFAQKLIAGDYLLVGGTAPQVQWILQKTEEVKKRVKPGVNVFSWVGYVAIADLEAGVPSVPKEIDWIVYDYEGGPNFSPEFTRDQTASIGFFDRGRRVANENGFKFMVTPPYAQLRTANWDWGEVAQHMDGMDLQFQALLQNLDFLEQEVKKVVGQIAEESPATLTFIQLSVTPTRGTPQDNVNAIQRLGNEKQIAAFLIFYPPPQMDLLTEFFAKFQRCEAKNTKARGGRKP